jgi:dihydroorotate dehydrogenase
VFRRLDSYRAKTGHAGPLIGVNLGKNRDSEDAAADYAAGIVRFSGLTDYLVVNISSPNTPGLRSLQSAEQLRLLLDRLAEARARAGLRPPMLLKLAPDLLPDERAVIAEVAITHGIDGLILGNTTVTRPPELRSRHRGESGGLSGRPLFALSTSLLADFAKLTQGRLILVGVGGVASGADAYAKIRAGASLVQLYTALIYEGPGLVRRIKAELKALLERDGYATVTAAVASGLTAASTARVGAL